MAQRENFEDPSLALLQRRTQEALARSGLTVEDFLNALPQARATVVVEAYGENFLHELERRYGVASSDTERK
jgi:hypothetical protein